MRNALRALNGRLKRLAIHALALLVRPHVLQSSPSWSARPHRILYLRYDRIGDMVLATGIIKAIAVGQPSITIDVLASMRNGSVLHHNPYVNEVHAIARKSAWSYFVAVGRLRRIHYDAVVDTAVMAPSLTTTLLMWAIGAPHRIGVAGRGNDFALTLPVARLPGAAHYVEHSASLLRAFGIDVRPDQSPKATRALPCDRGAASDEPSAENHFRIFRPEIYLSRDELDEAEMIWLAAAGAYRAQPEKPRRFLVNVSAGQYWRYWPEARFVAALRHLRACHPTLCVVVIGAPEDGPRKVRIGLRAGVPVADTERVRQMMAMVAAADVVFTADTSVTHIASAFSKAAVVMFARGGGRLYGPYATAGRTVSTPGPTLDSLDLEPVIRALDEILSAGSVSGAPDPGAFMPLPSDSLWAGMPDGQPLCAASDLRGTEPAEK